MKSELHLTYARVSTMIFRTGSISIYQLELLLEYLMTLSWPLATLVAHLSLATNVVKY